LTAACCKQMVADVIARN